MSALSSLVFACKRTQSRLVKKEQNKIKQMNKHERKAYMKKQGKGRR